MNDITLVASRSNADANAARHVGHGEANTQRHDEPTTLELVSDNSEAAITRSLDDPGLSSIIRYALDTCPFGIVIFGPDHRMLFSNAVFYSFLKLSPTVFPIGSVFEEIVEFMIERGDIVGDHHDAKLILAEQIELAKYEGPRTFHRARANGKQMAITGWPLPNGGFVRTYFDATAAREEAWEMRARIRLLRRRIQDLEGNMAVASSVGF